MRAKADDLWVIVPNWDRFQHYTDRSPVWVKLYTELNRRDDWRGLTYTERGLLVSIWCEYAPANGLLRQSDSAARYGASTRPQQWESLNHAGFIQLSASKPVSLSRARARALAREEVEKNKHAHAREEKPPKREPKQNAGAYRHTDHVERIATLIRNGVIADQVALAAELGEQPIPDELAAQLRAQLNGATDDPDQEDLF